MSEEVIEECAEKMAKLSIEFAKRTGYILIPGGPFGTAIPVPLKWFPGLEKAINELKKEEASEK